MVIQFANESMPGPTNSPSCPGRLTSDRFKRIGGIDANILLILVLLLIFVVPSSGEIQHVLCNEGSGGFSSRFYTGVGVEVGASKRNNGFASHTCDAVLHWKDHDLAVARGASQIDIDVMGADLGLGVPIVAFQVRNSPRDVGMTYHLYSLDSPPKLLRTITGAGYYNTQDLKLADRNEIWTDDALAADGFENLPLSSYDFPPTVVLRFEKRRMLDVSAEFQSSFDRTIADLKAQLNAEAVDKFKRSDGRLLSVPPSSSGDLRQLISTKVKVLEIVWSYLYSGRQDEAWNDLAEMWPPQDFERIRTAVSDLRSRGMLHQVDGNESRERRLPWKHHAVIFDMVTVTHQMLDDKNNVMSVPDDPALVSAGHSGEQTLTTVDTAPQAIYLNLLASAEFGSVVPKRRIYLNLVVDAAGKVRSAQLENPASNDAASTAEVAASASWKFIPAFRSGRAVACRIRMGVSPLR